MHFRDEAPLTIPQSLAENISVLELDEVDRHYADYLILATGNNERHLQAMAHAIKTEFACEKVRMVRRERELAAPPGLTRARA